MADFLPPFKMHELLPDKSLEMLKNILSCNVKESAKKIPVSAPKSDDLVLGS